MIVFYNFCQLLVLLIAWPVILLAILLIPKYRKGIPARLGFGLRRKLQARPAGGKTIWIHALSVGEVSSARPLVAGLHNEYPEHTIVFSATTRTGLSMAASILTPLVDAIIPSPIDLQPTVARYLHLIQPDLFILVETDFWPNLLYALQRKNIPAILVNGRISPKSMSAYVKWRLFFRPLFQSFSQLCLQTENDKKNMLHFGVKIETLHCLGNLKYDTPPQTSQQNQTSAAEYIPAGSLVFLAGSTHEGEEDIILSTYLALKKQFNNLFIIIAPRNPQRRGEIASLAMNCNLAWSYKSEPKKEQYDVFIIDTMGELAGIYRLADIAFVGGSLVRQGGHNPIEPASAGIPVLFGPHMDDFQEIGRDLLLAGGAIEVADRSSLLQTLQLLLSSEEERKKMGTLGQECISRQRGAVKRHLELIRDYL